MISNICAFLLCCFAITLSINKTESTGNNQIHPGPFLIPSIHKNYLRAVNSMKTFNEHTKIVIKPKDEKILSEQSCRSIDKYKLKLKSWAKLERKARDIICSFCVISQSNMLNLKNIVEKLKSGEPFIDNENTLIRLKQEAEMIYILFPFENLQMGKWFWSYFLKVIAVRRYDDNKDFIHENPFEDLQLQTEISDFIGSCTAENYLPPTAMEPDFVSNNMDMNDNMFTDLFGSVWFSDALFFLHPLDNQYDSMIEFLYLKPFWDDESQLLFKEIAPGVNVDWSMVRQRHQDEVVITREYLENRTWIHKPYDRLDHQHLLVKIIDARFYCYISVILYVYEKQLSILNELDLARIKNMICNLFQRALKISVKDEFLVFILSELKLKNEIDDIKNIFVRVRAEAYGILKDLNGVNSNEIDWLSFNVNEDQLSDDGFIMIPLEGFSNYLDELRIHIRPFEYKTLLHFMDVVRFSAARVI